jgi:hypothetical protein
MMLGIRHHEVNRSPSEAYFDQTWMPDDIERTGERMT